MRGWLPKEPSLQVNKTIIATNKGKTEIDDKAIKALGIANAVMIGSFLGTYDLIDPFNKSIELTILSWSIFVPTVILANILIYRHFKKQKTPTKKLKT
jgi:hypothetical protein